jgi:hypothetical protein
MVFTVIWITPGLSHNDYRRALEAAPEFGEVETDYPTLLRQTGWTVTDSTNVTEGYASWTLTSRKAYLPSRQDRLIEQRGCIEDFKEQGFQRDSRME